MTDAHLEPCFRNQPDKCASTHGGGGSDNDMMEKALMSQGQMVAEHKMFCCCLSVDHGEMFQPAFEIFLSGIAAMTPFASCRSLAVIGFCADRSGPCRQQGDVDGRPNKINTFTPKRTDLDLHILCGS